MSIATSYAKALLETIQEAKLSDAEQDQIEQMLGEFARMVDESSEVRAALLGPMMGEAEKEAVIRKFSERLGGNSLFTKYLLLLMRKRRIGWLNKIHHSFGELRLESQGGVMGSLISAESLDSAEVDELAGLLGRKLGKRVSFRVSVDPGLVAGIKIIIAGVTYDGTLRAQLQRLRDQLIHGVEASR